MGERKSAKLSKHITQAPALFITGAGASAPLDRWTTTEFLDNFRGSLPPQLAATLELIIDSCRPSEELDTLDIEEVLDHIEGTNHSVETLKKNKQLKRMLVDRQPPRDELQHLLDEYTRIKDQAYDLVVEHYRDIDPAEAAKLYAPIFVDLPELEGTRTLPIFTLNYDLAVEMACEAAGMALVDGMDANSRRRSWSAGRFHGYSPQENPTAVLFKLHGSVSWCSTPAKQIIEIHDTHRDPAPNSHCILYPSMLHKKDGVEPFRTAYRYLGACLENARIAVIIGTTLRDGRLVDTLSQGADRNPNLTFVNCRPSADSAGAAARLGIEEDRVIPIAGRFGDKKVNDRITSEVMRALETTGPG